MWRSAAAAAVLAFLVVATTARAQQTPPINPPQVPTWTMNQAAKSVAITPTNGATFGPTKAIYTAGTSAGGACVMVMKLFLDSATQTWTNVPAGAVLPVMAIDIEASGTTCTGVLALY